MGKLRNVVAGGWIPLFWMAASGGGIPIDASNSAAEKMLTLLDCRQENRVLVMTIYTIPIRQNRSVSFFFKFERGGET